MPNDDLISRDTAINLIEGFQRELCPVGTFGRYAVYGSDRDKFDDWQSIIDELEMIPAVDAAPVKHGHIEIEVINPYNGEGCYCSECGHWGLLPDYKWCPYCSARLDGDPNA